MGGLNTIGDQLAQRRLRDDQLSADVTIDMASAITGRFLNQGDGEQEAVQNAISSILDFYKIKTEVNVTLEEGEKLEDALDEVLLPLGIMRREVTLTSGWYKRAIGPMLGKSDDGDIIALVPNEAGKYTYINAKTGVREKVKKKNASSISNKALCFYKPLPARPITIRDLLAYMIETLTTADFFLYGGTLVGVTLVSLLIPFINRYLLGSVVESESIYMLAGTGIFFICTVIARSLVGIAGNVISVRITTKQELSITSALMMRVLSLPASVFKDNSAGEISKYMDYIRDLCCSLILSTFDIILSFILSLAYVFQIFAFAPGLVGPALVVAGVNLAFGVISTVFSVRQESKIMSAEAKEYGLSYSLISGIQKIKISGAEKRAFSKWGKMYARNLGYYYNPPLLIKLSGTISLAIMLLGQIWMYMGALSDGVSVADYYAFTSAYGMASAAFIGISDLGYLAAKIRPTLELVKPILDAKPELNTSCDVIKRLRGKIEVEHLFFRYDPDAPYVINDMSFSIKSGEYVGIVGTTGCGKSTLLRLLLGFENPTLGAVYYDGRDLSTLDKTSVRRKIGSVLQNGKLFAGSIFENIAISSPLMTQDEAWEALEMAGVADEIRRMPMGINTVLPEGGGGLSGGQRQRLMIARAIANKPKILFFDEATSALDNVTQKAVTEAVETLKCTRICVAHRLSTIKECDRILVLDQGKVAEEGTYEDLIKANGLFAELVKRQRVEVEE